MPTKPGVGSRKPLKAAPKSPAETAEVDVDGEGEDDCRFSIGIASCAKCSSNPAGQRMRTRRDDQAKQCRSCSTRATAHAGVPAASGLPRHRDHGVARGRASISSQGRLPSSATIYTIAVVEELGVQALTLRHVLWIGGPPGTGKTAVATRIARRHGLRWYGADTRTWQHRDRALRAGNPAARRWETMTPQERWVQSTPTQMLEMSLHAERGPMVLDDLRALPDSPLVVAEGSTLPAQSVSSGLADRSRAVWLLPTDDFQRALLGARDTPPGPTALYLLLRDRIASEASQHGAPTLILDGSLDLEATVTAVEELFAAALAEGPGAETRAERRVLLREANEAIVAQVRGYYARPWAEGDAESVVREFLCECGSTACHASVHVPVATVLAGAVLAPGHR